MSGLGADSCVDDEQQDDVWDTSFLNDDDDDDVVVNEYFDELLDAVDVTFDEGEMMATNDDSRVKILTTSRCQTTMMMNLLIGCGSLGKLRRLVDSVLVSCSPPHEIVF